MSEENLEKTIISETTDNVDDQVGDEETTSVDEDDEGVDKGESTDSGREDQGDAEDEEDREEEEEDKDSVFDPESLDLPKEIKETKEFKEFVDIAKESNLDKNTAERLIKWYQERQNAQWEEFQKTVNDWAKKANQMLGSNAQEALSNVGLAIKRFLSPDEEQELRTLLDSTGVGNHPVLVKLMVELSRRAVGGGFAQGEPVATKKKSSPVDLFYGNKE